MATEHKGFSLIELIICLLIIGIIAAIAIPNLLAARRSANESSAISSLRVLATAQATYYLTAGAGNYAGTISDTGDVSGIQTLAATHLVDPALGSAVKSGYMFVGGRQPSGGSIPGSFFFACAPTSTSGATITGRYNYGIATDGVLHYADGSSTQLDKGGVANGAVVGN